MWDSVLGSHGEATKDDSGGRLLQSCSVNETLVTNTWFQHKDVNGSLSLTQVCIVPIAHGNRCYMVKTWKVGTCVLGHIL